MKNIHWTVWGAATLFAAIVGAMAWFILALAAYQDPEPTSRCLDSKYRIFERDHSFSVVEDVSCLNG